MSIQSLFGKFCSGEEFAYDEMMRSVFPPEEHNARDNSQASGKESAAEQDSSPYIMVFPADNSANFKQPPGGDDSETSQERPQKRGFEQLGEDTGEVQDEDSQRTDTSITSQILNTHSASRHESYNKVVGNVYDGEWSVTPLLSIDGHHGVREEEM